MSDANLAPWLFALWAIGAVHTAAMVRLMARARGDEPDVDIMLTHALGWPLVAVGMFVVSIFGIAMAIATGDDGEDDEGQRKDDASPAADDEDAS